MEFKFRDECKIKGLTRQEPEMLCMQCKLQSSKNMEFDEKLGQFDIHWSAGKLHWTLFFLALTG